MFAPGRQTALPIYVYIYIYTAREQRLSILQDDTEDTVHRSLGQVYIRVKVFERAMWPSTRTGRAKIRRRICVIQVYLYTYKILYYTRGLVVVVVVVIVVYSTRGKLAYDIIVVVVRARVRPYGNLHEPRTCVLHICRGCDGGGGGERDRICRPGPCARACVCFYI